MTPAVEAARRAGVPFELVRYEHDPRAESYALEAAEQLGVDPARVFKTLVAQLDDGALVVGIIPAPARLDARALAAAAGARSARLAPPAEAERATGYVVGGISPLGQKRRLRTLVDASAQAFETIYVSAGRRGVELELRPDDLVHLTAGSVASIART